MIYDDLKYFNKHEWLSPDGLVLVNRGIIPHDPRFLLMFDDFREYIDVPIQINNGKHRLRGFRSPAEQYRLYNNTHRFTYHFWCAADSTPKGMDLWEYFYAAVKFGFRGAYIDPAANFVHLDYRPGPKWIRKRENGNFYLVEVH